jgi:hypothetical protein
MKENRILRNSILHQPEVVLVLFTEEIFSFSLRHELSASHVLVSGRWGYAVTNDPSR